MSHARTPQTLKRDLQIVAWNANGLSTKLGELQEFIARHKPDMLLINETHLAPTKKVRIPNYVLNRDDRQTRTGGGTAIAMKTSIRHHRVPLPSLGCLEATAVELPGVLGGLLLVSAYKPPRPELPVDDLTAVFAAHRKVILVGDLNCKHTG